MYFIYLFVCSFTVFLYSDLFIEVGQLGGETRRDRVIPRKVRCTNVGRGGTFFSPRMFLNCVSVKKKKSIVSVM